MDKKQALYNYCLQLGDTSLILGHRLSEWCGHGPILEEDIALTNISLDLVGQATNILGYAADVDGTGKTADDLAFKRVERKFNNLLIAEQPNGDYAVTITRQLLFDAYHYFLLQQLQNSTDEYIRGYALKSLKEVTYHLKHSKDWALRLGDGTEESHNRMQAALDSLWKFTGEFFEPCEAETIMQEAGIGADLTKVKQQWTEAIEAILTQATLTIPTNNWAQTGGKVGIHSENLGYILAEMQYLPRAYPDATW